MMIVLTGKIRALEALCVMVHRSKLSPKAVGCEPEALGEHGPVEVSEAPKRSDECHIILQSHGSCANVASSSPHLFWKPLQYYLGHSRSLSTFVRRYHHVR